MDPEGVSELGLFNINSQLANAGGPVLVVLGMMSVVALAIILIKFWQFWSMRASAREFMDHAIRRWRSGDQDGAIADLGLHPNPIARVLEIIMYGQSQNLEESLVREEAQRIAVFLLTDARRYLRGLEVIAALSPLLGLLGTVLGMIDAFQALEQAGTQADPAVLSGGIWEALLTTAAGLTVAIPVVAVLNWLEHVVDDMRAAMEDAMTRMFTGGESMRPHHNQQPAAKPVRV